MCFLMPVTPVPKIFWPLQGLNACGTYTYTQTLIYIKEKLQRREAGDIIRNLRKEVCLSIGNDSVLWLRIGNRRFLKNGNIIILIYKRHHGDLE